MREEERKAFVRATVRDHLQRLVGELGWAELVASGQDALAQERLGLTWYEIKADLMLRRVGARRSEILSHFEEILQPDHRDRYHDLVAYDPEIPQPEAEAVDQVWAARIGEAVHDAVRPLRERLDELVAAPWRFAAELELAFRTILDLLEERAIRGSSRVILSALIKELPGVPPPFLWGVLAFESAWTKIEMPALVSASVEPSQPPARAAAEDKILSLALPGEGDPGPPAELTAEAFATAWGHLLWHLQGPVHTLPDTLRDTLRGWEAECRDDPMVVGLWAHMLHRLATRHLHQLERTAAATDLLVPARHLRAAVGMLLARSTPGGRDQS